MALESLDLAFGKVENTLYPQKVGTNFADKWRSLGRIVRLRTEATEFL
jgi:hypothetical protein